MTLLYWIGALVTVVLAAYLVVAMFRPEKF